jgi:tetratricopeptide (TPR) repeat protein
VVAKKSFDFKQIHQEPQHDPGAEVADGVSVVCTIGDLNDLIDQLKEAYDLDSHSQMQKRITSLIEMFNNQKISELPKVEEATAVQGIRLHEVANHSRHIPSMTVSEKLDLMNDRWNRVADKKLVAFLPDHVSMMYIEAMEHLKMNKEALQFLDQYEQMKNLEGQPISEAMLLLIARAHIERARSVDPVKCTHSILLARKRLLVLLHQDPYNIPAHLCMAYLWCHESMLDQAEYHIMTVLHLNPKCSEGLQLRAQFNASLGNLYAAESDISQACRINPEDANLFITYASIKKLIPCSDNQVSANLGEALGYRISEADIIASALNANSNERNVLVYIGVSLLEASRFQDAAEIFSKCISLYPFDAAAHMNRGIAFSCLNKVTEARENFQVAARLNPYHADTLLNFAFLEDTCQKSGLAQRLLEKAVDVCPLDADIHEVRANFYAKIGRATKGRLAAQTAHWLRSDNFDQAKSMGLRFWNFVLERENGSTTCDNMGIYGINVISMTLVAKARPISMHADKQDEKAREKTKTAITHEIYCSKADPEAMKATDAKATSGATGKSPKAKFIQSVPMHDGIGRNYSNNPKSAVVPKPPKPKTTAAPK